MPDIAADVVIDAHTHILPPLTPARTAGEPVFEAFLASGARGAGASELLAAMDGSGVSRAVTAAFPWRRQDLCRESNEYLLDCVSRHPHRLTGLATVNPAEPGATEEAARCVAAGLAGVGELHPELQGFELDSSGMSELCAALEELGAILMLHVNEPVGHFYPGKESIGLAEVYRLALRFPKLRIILPHWGGGLFLYELMPEVAEAMRNVYYDSAASPFLYTAGIHATAESCGVGHKLLFGTDFPLLPYRRCLENAAAGGLSEQARAAFMAGNAARLMGPGFPDRTG
ncbi:MAG: amidohydrolase family protein [Candidatus Geothermincolia bacterium]